MSVIIVDRPYNNMPTNRDKKIKIVNNYQQNCNFSIGYDWLVSFHHSMICSPEFLKLCRTSRNCRPRQASYPLNSFTVTSKSSSSSSFRHLWVRHTRHAPRSVAASFLVRTARPTPCPQTEHKCLFHRRGQYFRGCGPPANADFQARPLLPDLGPAQSTTFAYHSNRRRAPAHPPSRVLCRLNGVVVPSPSYKTFI